MEGKGVRESEIRNPESEIRNPLTTTDTKKGEE
jgi:hypothetical protein